VYFICLRDKNKNLQYKNLCCPRGKAKQNLVGWQAKAERGVLSKRFQKAIVWGKSLKNKNKNGGRGGQQDCETKKKKLKYKKKIERSGENMELGKLYALIKTEEEG